MTNRHRLSRSAIEAEAPSHTADAERAYSETLRLIGQFLDQERALRIRISEDETYIAFSWLGTALRWENYAYRKGAGLELLRGALGEIQRRGAPDSRDCWGERLRIIGQDLDEQRVRLVELADVRGFDVRGEGTGGKVRRWYSTDELRHRSLERRSLRGQRGPEPRTRLSKWLRNIFSRANHPGPPRH